MELVIEGNDLDLNAWLVLNGPAHHETVYFSFARSQRAISGSNSRRHYSEAFTTDDLVAIWMAAGWSCPPAEGDAAGDAIPCRHLARLSHARHMMR
jgi:hypothetical protein